MPPRKGDSQQTTTALLSQKLDTVVATQATLGSQMAEGFKGMHERQDTTNGKVLKAGTDILENKASFERQIDALRAEFKYNRVIWYFLTVSVSVIVALTSYILLK